MGTMFPQPPSQPIDNFNPLADFEKPNGGVPFALPDDGSSERVAAALSRITNLLNQALAAVPVIQQRYESNYAPINVPGALADTLFAALYPISQAFNTTTRVIQLLLQYRALVNAWEGTHKADMLIGVVDPALFPQPPNELLTLIPGLAAF